MIQPANELEALLARHEKEASEAKDRPISFDALVDLVMEHYAALASHARSLQSDLDAARQEIAELRERVIEECAKVALVSVRRGRDFTHLEPSLSTIGYAYAVGANDMSQDIAAAIRALAKG